MRVFLTAAVAVLTLLPPSQLASQVHERSALVAALDSAARAHVASEFVAGASVAVIRGADTLLLRGYGVADLEWNVPTPEDASATYEIGSLTKQFTAASILLLVQAGLINLDADVTDYLPDFDTAGHQVSIRRLLDHTSGIRGMTEMPTFRRIRSEKLPRDTLVRLIEAEPFDFEPGTAQIYNNSAYFLLGLVIEAVSGKTYEGFVQERLFDPLGMRDSYYCSESVVRAGKTHGYDRGPSGLIQRRYVDHTWPYSGGSLCSSARDLVRWNQALHGGEVLNPDSYRAMTTPQPLVDGTPLEYGMGLRFGDRAGSPVISHEGSIPGFLSSGSYYPAADLIIVVLQNSAAGQGPYSLVVAFADLLLGPEPPLLATTYDGDADQLLGEYAGPGRGEHLHYTVSRDGDQLVFSRRGRAQDQRPTHVGAGVWVNGGTRYSFEIAGGRARELMVSQGASRYRLIRVR